MDRPYSELSVTEILEALLLESDDLSNFLDELAAFAARDISTQNKVLCGITLERGKRPITVASSNAEARRMDEMQVGFDEGPCLDALRTNTLIHVTDLSTETRWPDYTNAVLEHGLLSVAAVPIALHDRARAAMNLFTGGPFGFDGEAISTALVYAKQIATALDLAMRIAKQSELARHRQAAMESRTSIDIAVGIIMAQNNCSQDKAVEILKNASSHRNIKLRDLAVELVTTVGRTGPITAFDE